MLKGIDVNEVKEYISVQDKSDNTTKFLIKNITIKDKMAIFSGALDQSGQFDISKMQDKAVDIFKAGVKEILNLNGVDYKEITDEVINKLSFVIIVNRWGS